MERRTFVATVAASLVTAAVSAEAQQATNVRRIGYLTISGSLAPPALEEAFRRALRDLGYIEGRNVVIEYRSAEGKAERLPALAAELVARNVDVIVTAAGTVVALVVKQRITNVPVVFIAAGDPVTSGLVGSLARPGGNVTGLSLLFPELVGKSLEQLKEAVPGVGRVAVLWQPGAVPERTENDIRKESEVAARALGVAVQFIEARNAAAVDRAFSTMARQRVDAVTVFSTPLLASQRRRIAELAAKNRLPTIFSFRQYVDAGGLMSYGPDLADLFRRAASYVDKILKGAKPGDLPVEQPTKFELVINLKTAKALGLTIPQSLLLRADEVIQ